MYNALNRLLHLVSSIELEVLPYWVCSLVIVYVGFVVLGCWYLPGVIWRREQEKAVKRFELLETEISEEESEDQEFSETSEICQEDPVIGKG